MQRINAGHPRNASPGSALAESASDATVQHCGVVRLQQAPDDCGSHSETGRDRFDFTKADNALDFDQRKTEAAAA